jgi:hypothetical protein
VILDGETADEAGFIGASLDHNLSPTIELHTDDFRKVPRAEEHGPKSVLQVQAAPLAERLVVNHVRSIPPTSNALTCRCPVHSHADERSDLRSRWSGWVRPEG